MDLTEEQERAFKLFKGGRSLFITGPAGCGKSYLIKYIKEYCQDKDISIAVTAMTGAAGALISGQTLHGWGGLGLAKHDSSLIARNIMSKNFQARKRWRDTRILVIDEISMMGADLFNKVNKIAQYVRGSSYFFGGLQMIFCGDFAQLEPIGTKRLCFESLAWHDHIDDNTVYIKRIIRQADPTFQEMLCEIRLGILSERTVKLLKSRLIKKSDLTDANIVIEDETGKKETVLQTILYPHKADVEKINQEELAKLIANGAESKIYNSSDCIVEKESNMAKGLSKNEKENFNKVCNSSPKIELCVGAQVMLISNIDIENGLVNGSRGVVTKLGFLPTVVFDNGHEVELERVNFEVDMGKQCIKRLQIPLILGWALTIHKCQGATLTSVVTDLSKVFCNAQSYVTLSRVRSLDGLFLLGINLKTIKCNPKVKEYYKKLEL